MLKHEQEREKREMEHRGDIKKKEIGNFFAVLQRQTHTITTPFVFMFFLS